MHGKVDTNLMIKLIGIGLLASAFFSATFILNRSMSLSGGHWVWSSSLRFMYMIGLLIIIIMIRHGFGHLRNIFFVYVTHFFFWTIAGCIGFGVFYSALCFAADHAPGWVVAGTWQFTIIASPIVLFLFKEKVPKSGILFSVIIFIGISLIQFFQTEHKIDLRHIYLGFLPVFIAAFAYPTGNQLLNFSKHGNKNFVPHIDSPVLQDSLSCILLMTLGSVPYWILLILIVMPPAPSQNQLISTGIVAVSSGIIATALFYKARNTSEDPYVIAGVDATQSGEVLFSLVGEIILLNGAFPTEFGALGILLILAGIVGYSLKKE